MPIATINPATGETLKTFEQLSDAQIDRKLQIAAEAFSKYRKSSFAERARLMQRAAEILEGKKEKFARMMTTEMGDRKSTRLNSSHANISYAVFCLKKK